MAAPDPPSPSRPVVVDCRSEPADLAAIDRLARLALAARRDGRAVRLWAATAELRALLDLCGLDATMPPIDETGAAPGGPGPPPRGPAP